MKPTGLIVLTALAGLLPAGLLWGQPSAVEERVAVLKQTLQNDQAKLKQYEWIETTTVSVKGKEVSRTENRCYWGAEGKVQKVPVAPPEEPKKKRGMRGRIAEKKKEQLTEEMKNAVELVRLYVPPDPNRIAAVQKAGKASIQMIEPGKRVRLDFRDYRRAGDTLGVEIDPANNRLRGVQVATYLADPKDPVALAVKFASLADGTGYPAQTTLDLKDKGIQVKVDNSGYRKIKQESPSREEPPSKS